MTGPSIVVSAIAATFVLPVLQTLWNRLQDDRPVISAFLLGFTTVIAFALSMIFLTATQEPFVYVAF